MKKSSVKATDSFAFASSDNALNASFAAVISAFVTSPKSDKSFIESTSNANTAA